MAKADRSIDPHILESTKHEFLTYGFEKASLKEICDRARVTTGALYKRYRGKEDLFCAVVTDTVSDLKNIIEEKTSVQLSLLSDEDLIQAWNMDEEYMIWWFQYLYDRHDGFVLLLKCAEGTVYSNFQHDWVESMTKSTYEFYEEAYRRGLARTKLSKEELHILLSAFWTTIYEPFIHDFTWEQIKHHSKIMCDLFNWYRVMEFPEKD